jgi:hypothetical protein
MIQRSPLLSVIYPALSLGFPLLIRHRGQARAIEVDMRSMKNSWLRCSTAVTP